MESKRWRVQLDPCYYIIISEDTPAWEWADFLFTLLIYTLQKDKERRNGFASDEGSNKQITSSSEEATHPRPYGS